MYNFLGVGIGVTISFAGTPTTPPRYADLAAIKINNYMTEWENPNYNLKYKGNNILNVVVPYTNKLKITDLITSPKTEATIYSDKALKNKVQELTTFSIYGKETSLYVSVKNLLRKTTYQINIKVADAIIPNGYLLSDIPMDNADGHLWLPSNVFSVVLDNIEYNIVRTQTELETIGTGRDVNKNYIIANDLTLTDFSTIGINNRDPSYPSNYAVLIKEFIGILDGNNYVINIENILTVYNGLFALKALMAFSKGLVKNIIVDSENVIYGQAGIVAVSVDGSITNCVNKMDIAKSSDVYQCREMIGGMCTQFFACKKETKSMLSEVH